MEIATPAGEIALSADHPSTRFLTDWRLFAAAGAAALAATSGADAGIIVGNTSVDLKIPAAIPHSGLTTVTQKFKVGNSNETAIIRRTAESTLGRQLHLYGTRVFLQGNMKFVGNSSSHDPVVGKSQLIQRTNTTQGVELFGHQRGTFNTAAHKTQGNLGGGPVDRTAFVGFETVNNDIGWLQLELLGNSNNNTVDELTTAGYAYTDAATITSGQTTDSVPEPTALGLLALGSAGVLAWRRRRTAAVTE